MTPLRTARLVIRAWREEDRPLFHRINSDDRVMEFFPFRRDRAQSDALMDRLNDDIAAHGYGFAALELAESGELLGFCGVKQVDDLEPHVPAGELEIGWRLAPEAWGKGYVTESARAWLGFAFDRLEAERVWSFAVASNSRSLAVMRRLGMSEVGAFDHPRVPDTHPGLARHTLYRIARPDWRLE